jgi:hypothetical protein
MKKFKNLINEIQQPLSQGEKNFKAMHGDLPAAIEKAKKLVPGITDQDVLFNGRPRRMDVPTASKEIYKDDDESVEDYDKGLKVKSEPERDRDIKETTRKIIGEKTLTPAEIKKREEIAKAMERDNPGMPMDKKMAIATATAKKVAEEVKLEENIGGLFKDVSEWERSAKDRGLVVKSMTHPSGEATKYQIAKDKQGNNRGHFDHGTKSGRLKEEVDEALKGNQHKIDVNKNNKIDAEDFKLLKKKKEVMKEQSDIDYEGEMARSELNAICDKSRKLADMMADDMQLEAWLQSKITKAKYMIDSVYDYLMYSDKQSGMQSTMPSADASSYAQTPTMAANYSSFLNKMAEEKILSAKQERIARLAGDEDEIDADDFKKLRSSKKGSDTEDATAHRKKIISRTVEEAKEDDEEKADKQSGASLNPITRLNAAHQLLRGKIGVKHPIKFDDGKHELDINTVRKALDLHGNAKTATEKEKIQNAYKTHAGLQDALKGKFAAPRSKVSLGGSKRIGGIGEYGSIIQEDSDLDERVNPTTRPAAVGPLRASTYRDKDGVLRMRTPKKGMPSNRDVVDASIAEGKEPILSKVNMQQDSLDRLNAMSPQASKIKTKLPPTQGNKSIGGEEEVYPNVALQETMLNNLYHTLSEDNKATFMEKLRTEDGLTELLQFAQEQGL